MNLLCAKGEEKNCEAKYKKLEERFEKLHKRFRTKMSDIKRLTASERPMYYREIEHILGAIEDGKKDTDKIYIERLNRDIPLAQAKPVVTLYPQEWCTDFFTEDRKQKGDTGEEFQMSLLMQVLMFQPKAFNWLVESFDDSLRAESKGDPDYKFEAEYLSVSLEQYKRLMRYINTNKILNDKNNEENFELLENSILKLKNTTKDIKKLIKERKSAYVKLKKILNTMESISSNKMSIGDTAYEEYEKKLIDYGSIKSEFVPQDIKNQINDLMQEIKKKKNSRPTFTRPAVSYR